MIEVLDFHFDSINVMCLLLYFDPFYLLNVKGICAHSSHMYVIRVALKILLQKDT